MTKNRWRGWLKSVARNITGEQWRDGGRKPRRQSSRRLTLERLEDRLAPATNITVIFGAAGTGTLDHFLDATHGTIATTDDPGDMAATLSTGALGGVNSTTNISIAADSAISFSDLGLLLLQTGAGNSASFSTNTGPINFANALNLVATSAGSLSLRAGTDLTVANLDSNGGDVNLTAGIAGAGSLSAQSILNAGAVSINTVDGDVTLNQSFLGGIDGTTVSVTAGGLDHILTNNATISAASNVTLTADRMALGGGTISTNIGGSNVVQLEPFSTSRTIDLGGTSDPTGTLQISQAELNTITADIVRIGSTTAGNLTVTAAITAPAGWSTLSLISGGTIGETAFGDTLNVTNLALQGAGGVSLLDDNVVTQAAGSTAGAPFFFSAFHALTVGSVDGVSGITTQGGLGGEVIVRVVNGGLLTVSNPINSGNAGIFLDANTMAINNTITAGTGTVQLGTVNFPMDVTLGTIVPGTLSLTDAELDQVNASVLRIGDLLVPVGSITVTAPIDAETHYATLSLSAIGPIIDSNTTEPDISVSNLALRAGGGISLDTAVTSLAFSNTGGAVSVRNTGALTIASVDGLTTSSNTGTTTTLSAAGPLTFAVDTISAGTLTATTTETATETTTPLPPPDDNITVNSGVTVESTGGDVVFTSGDSIVLQSGSTVQAPIGKVTLNVGVGDNDNDATLELNGNISSANVALSSPGDICVSAISATDTVTITSTGGGIIDCNDPPTGTLNITATNLALSAFTGIGSVPDPNNPLATAADAPLETQVSNLAAATTSGGIFIDNTGDLTIGTADGLSGITTNGGTISVSTTDGNLTVAQNVAAGAAAVNLTAGCNPGTDNELTNNAAITGNTAALTADRMILDGGTINLGTGASNIVTLQPCTPGRTIDLGGAGDPTGTLQLSQAELDTLTAGIARIGSTTAGSLTVTAAIAPANFATLTLISNGAVTETGTGAITITNLDVQGAGGVSLGDTNQVSTLAGNTANQAFVFTNGGGTLTVGTVDGVTDINAGTGDVSLTVGTAMTTGILVSQFPNDNVADVTGGTVTLTALGPTNGATGQIGFFTSSAQFFEVAATTINASTNNSRLWISAIGGAAVGSVNAGTDTAILKTVNGDLTSTHTGSTPDITGGTVILLSPGTTGSFGSASSPLLLQTSNLRAGVTGTGSINATNVAAGGNLSVASATTTNGAINLSVAGGNLTTTATSGTDISAPGNTVTLRASGGIFTGTGSGITDVGATNLAITGASAVGVSGSPLKTALGDLAASVGAGGVFISNTGALTIGTVGSLNGVSATGGGVTITTSAGLNVNQAVSTTGAGVTLTGNGTINLNAAINGTSATVQGGAGADVFNVNVTGSTPLNLFGLAGNDTFNIPSSVGAAISVFGGAGTNVLNYNALNVPVGTVPGAIKTFGLKTVSYTGVQGINLNNAATVDAFYGPNTASRASALEGLTANERFVQVLYLDALGRAGSKSEIDSWATIFNLPNTSQSQAQTDIATGIEGSLEAREHLVGGWYLQYLGRAATASDEVQWANHLASQTEELVISEILGSTEFFNHAQTLGFSGSANSQYAQALSELLLHRAGSSAEVAAWVGAITSIGRQGLALAFLESAEFRTYQFEGYYSALLHRPGDSAGLNSWVSSGQNLFTVRIGFEGSLEFFTKG